MPRINLLPWREELRKQKKAEYLAILGVCAALAVAMWFAVHLYFGELINQQNARNAFRLSVSAWRIAAMISP